MSDANERRGWGQLALRLAVGFGFVAHGWAKLSRGPDGFGNILAAIGVPMPHLAAWVTALLEFAGGIAVMAGAFIAPISVPLAAVMLTAMMTVHWRYGYSSIRLLSVSDAGAQFGPIGYELNLLYIAALVALAIGGPGPFAFGDLLSRRRT